MTADGAFHVNVIITALSLLLLPDGRTSKSELVKE